VLASNELVKRFWDETKDILRLRGSGGVLALVYAEDNGDRKEVWE
jgi:hypothetical protein